MYIRIEEHKGHCKKKEKPKTLEDSNFNLVEEEEEWYWVSLLLLIMLTIYKFGIIIRPCEFTNYKTIENIHLVHKLSNEDFKDANFRLK